MNELKNQVKALIDDGRIHESDWQAKAVSVLTEVANQTGYDSYYIYDTNDYLWEDLVKHELETRGFVGVKCFLEDVDAQCDYAQVDAYGNGKSLYGDDLLSMLQEAYDEDLD